MIELIRKEDCCGCTACVWACPKSCITMTEDKEGFLYPSIDERECVHCRKCQQVCPILHNENRQITVSGNMSKEEYTRNRITAEKKIPDSYVLYLRDSSVRRDSTSGGAFSLFAESVLSRDGVIYGAAIDRNHQIKHMRVSCPQDLDKLRGAKYVQSQQDGIYEQVRDDLAVNRTVLYTGTPCQVAGLYKFLGREYGNLITIDIFCHGVGSPGYWNNYLSYMEDHYRSSIRRIKFREKTYGYHSACMAVSFSNGKSSRKDHDNDLFWTAFSKCYIFRPSCYECRFKQILHKSDFSIGDFWDVSGLPRQYEEADGCSLLLCHTQKGRDLLSQMGEKAEMEPIDLEKALIINGGHQVSMLIGSSHRPEKREAFLEEMGETQIDDLVKKYIPVSWKYRIKALIKPVLYKTGTLDRIKQLRSRLIRS